MKAIMNDEVMERLIDTLMELQKKESTDLPLLKKQLAETEKVLTICSTPVNLTWLKSRASRPF